MTPRKTSLFVGRSYAQERAIINHNYFQKLVNNRLNFKTIKRFITRMSLPSMKVAWTTMTKCFSNYQHSPINRVS